MSLGDPMGRRRDRAAERKQGTAGRAVPELRVGLLGQFGVEVDGVPLRLRGDKRRAMLVALLLNAGHTVPTGGLIERIWGSPPSPAGRSALQVHVARARALFDHHCGTPLIRGGDGGYRIDLAEDQSDLLCFRSLVRRAAEAARRGEPDTRVALLIRALGLWRGPVLSDVASPALHSRDVPPLNEELLRVAEEGFGAAMARGDHARVADQIGSIATHHPDREPLIRIQMIALYRSGRPSEALRVYTRTRDVLAEHLGVEPGRELQETLQSILRGDLDRAPLPGAPRRCAFTDGRTTSGAAGPEGVATEPVRVPDRVSAGLAPAELPAAPTTLIGRSGALTELYRLVDPCGAAPGSVLVRGPAGAGSSALALRWAHSAAPYFPDGQLYVNLRGGDGAPRDPAEVLCRLVRSLSSHAHDTRAMDADESAARFRTLLAHRRVLLVLDNASSAGQVRPLLPGSASCVAVVTSRYWLTDLMVRDGLRNLQVGPLSLEESVELLRAQAGANRCAESVLHRIARLSGCLPLPLRMAVVWLGTHPHRPAEDLVRCLEEVDPARGGTPTARMAAALRAGPEEGRHGRREVPVVSHPPETSLSQGSYVRLSPR